MTKINEKNQDLSLAYTILQVSSIQKITRLISALPNRVHLSN